MSRTVPHYDAQNPFAKILRGEIPADIVYEDDYVLAFNDISAAAPVHVLIIPRGEFCSFDDFAIQHPDHVGNFFHSVQKVAKAAGLSETGYRLITNHGADANQTVSHFHVHLLGGENLGGLLAHDALSR